MKIALAHDWLNQMGGAEKVLECLVDMFSSAPVYTTIYAPDLMPARYRQWDIRPTWLNRAPLIQRHHQPYLPFYPMAVQSMDFSGYDLILSNKSGFIHGLRHLPAQQHICYCLTPTRYVWDYHSYAAREGLARLLNLAIIPLIYRLKQWDFAAAQRVTYFIAISKEVQTRIKKYYHRDSVIIYPPVDCHRFNVSAELVGDYYLIVSRLIPYKRIDLAVQACTKLGKPLIVVGDGRDRFALEKIAGPTVTFKGRLPTSQVIQLMANCRAFLFPGFEDFGIAPVEAQAAGRPVIAFAKGGALDTVIEGLSGLFFYEQSVESLMEAIEKFETMSFSPSIAQANAARFSVERFKQELDLVIGKYMAMISQ